MTRTHHPRRLAATLLAGAALLVLAACDNGQYPNSIFTKHTEFNADVGSLFNRLFFWGTIVFVLVEALLLYVIIKFRRKPGQAEPKHVHGNTTLEVLWTAIPAVILVFIAVPTVRTIFRTQAKARPDALQVEVIGHQWWWEFRYPEYNITTANELYIPTGRTVNFALKTADVLHSFWIPALAGKRDLISNHTNFLWFTPDSALGAQSWNGHCAEYCGSSHANMKFRTYTVTPAEFDSWVKGQQAVAAFGATAAPGQTSGPATAGAAAAAAATQSQAAAQPAGPQAAAGQSALPANAAARSQAAPTPPAFTQGLPGTDTTAGATTPTSGVAAGYTYPMDKLPRHVRPSTPIPADIGRISDAVLAAGDAERGRKLYSSQSCIGCHYVNGNPMSLGKIGPNLTHFGSRNTLGAGLYPNDARTLAYWIKNTRKMKPGVVMPTLGLNEYDPVTKMQVKQGGLTDQQIADIVAYLLALK
ncbi:MAG: cytochrome c oxidase subunit II [Gemmatirosa sp.]